MIKYRNYIDNQKVPTASAKLSWSHYDELLKLNDEFEINYYVKIPEEQNLSIRQLREKIKLNEYKGLDEETKNKLLNKEKYDIVDFVKNSILIKSNLDYKEISEKVLKQLILEDLTSFLRELGKFSIQIKLKIIY